MIGSYHVTIVVTLFALTFFAQNKFCKKPFNNKMLFFFPFAFFPYTFVMEAGKVTFIGFPFVVFAVDHLGRGYTPSIILLIFYFCLNLLFFKWVCRLANLLISMCQNNN